MKAKILLIVTLLSFSFTNLKSQTDEEVINRILFELFGHQQDTIFIKNVKTKTYFDYDSISFNDETGLTVPSKIISEWQANVEDDDFQGQWNEEYLNKKDTFILDGEIHVGIKPVFKCLSRDEMNQIFERTKRRQCFYSITKILFDDSKENAIFDFMEIPWPGSFYLETIVIKKIFGKWVIVTKYNFMMT